jgi:predicted nucleic acid-binding protein
MKAFADTNFFTNLWTSLSHSAQADLLWSQAVATDVRLFVTRLVNLEYTNALQRLVYESRHGSQAVQISVEIAAIARMEMDDALQSGETVQLAAPDEAAVDAMFDSLVYRYTASLGFRTADIIHVASAIVLGCDTFWSFDERANRLAKLAGLQVSL